MFLCIHKEKKKKRNEIFDSLCIFNCEANKQKITTFNPLNFFFFKRKTFVYIYYIYLYIYLLRIYNFYYLVLPIFIKKGRT